jgi:D-threonate/D-erythronate kinase
VAAPLGTLVATGGDTVRGALEARGVRSLRVWAEIEAGIPVCTTESSRPLRVVTKAGGFGDAGALARVRTALRPAPARSLAR